MNPLINRPFFVEQSSTKNELVDLLQKSIRKLTSVEEHDWTKEHSEQESICSFLKLAIDSPIIKYPIKVTHRKPDRPDFELKLGDEMIGVEVTQSLSADLGNARAIRDEKYPDSLIDLALFRVHKDRRPRRELEKILADNKLFGPPWLGDSVENEWADMLLDKLERKTKKLNHTDFKKYEKNWLLIYDNHHVPILKISAACNVLEKKLEPYWGQKLCAVSFDSLFVETKNNLIRFDPDSPSLL